MEECRIVWNNALAYIVGLIASDGNLSKDGRHINLTSKDIQLIHVFQDYFGTNNKIQIKRGGFCDKEYYFLQISNKKLYNWLLEIGLTPNKSKTLEKINIQDNYFFDFLRGVFDGDGCFYCYWDNRWRSSFMFYVKFCAYNINFLKWIERKVRGLSNISGNINKGSGVWELSYPKKSSLRILEKIYYSSNLPCLHRKKDKVKHILEINKKNNEKYGRVLELVDIYV